MDELDGRVLSDEEAVTVAAGKVKIVLHKAWRDMTEAEMDAALEAAADKLYSSDEPSDGPAADESEAEREG